MTRNRNPALARLLIYATRSRIPVIGRAVGAFCNCDFTLRFVGPGLALPHPYGIVIHDRARIGSGCTVMQHVTIGSSPEKSGVPTLGDGVFVGVGAVILGEVKIGTRARIGANSVVLSDVPDGATAVGAPARVLDVNA
jgi:serine O-acetyltransferase